MHQNCASENSWGFTRRLLTLLFLFILFTSNAAMKAEAPEAKENNERRGYYETDVWLYERPEKDSKALIKIPHYTPLQIRLSSQPSQKGFGQTEYEHQTGFVRMAGLLDMPREFKDLREGMMMFAWDVRLLRSESLHGAEVIKRLQPETPVTILSRTKFMVKVDAEGQIGFMYGNDL